MVVGAATGLNGDSVAGQQASQFEIENNQFDLNDAASQIFRMMEAAPGGTGVRIGSSKLLALIAKLTADKKGVNQELLLVTKQMLSEDGVVKAILRESKPIFGAGTNRSLTDAPRLISTYGGSIDDWAKVTTPAYTLSDGTIISVHAYQNVKTGLVVEVKSILDKAPWAGIPR